MDWIVEAKSLFDVEKPKHFTDYNHCEECFDHDQILLNQTVDLIGLVELGNPGWDPLCYVDPQGFQYYFPALIRLCLNSSESDYYINQFLFHISYEGKNNRYMKAFSDRQVEFTLNFLDYLLGSRGDLIDLYNDSDLLIDTTIQWANE